MHSEYEVSKHRSMRFGTHLLTVLGGKLWRDRAASTLQSCLLVEYLRLTYFPRFSFNDGRKSAHYRERVEESRIKEEKKIHTSVLSVMLNESMVLCD